MKRMLKKIFSRLPFVALTIILIFLAEVLVIVGGVFVIEKIVTEAYPGAGVYVDWTLRVLDWLIVAVTVIHCANRDMVPETKIPWLLCIVLLNIFGVAIYVVFSSNRPSRRQRRMFESLYGRMKEYTVREIDKEQVLAAMGNWADVSEALNTENPFAVVHTGTKTEYFPSGEKFATRLLEDLENAREYIFMEYFIVAKGK
ncbi:MAG: PLDc N-terminal domain-containing protein, partial [Candidatus Scatosoma sp.]